MIYFMILGIALIGFIGRVPGILFISGLGSMIYGFAYDANLYYSIMFVIVGVFMAFSAFRMGKG